MGDKTHVPDKLHAFTLQVRHLMYELISIDLERIVSIEAYDDIAIEDTNKGNIIAEQIKSVLSNNNPLTDRADVFWKTFYNWIQYVEFGTLNILNTYFRFVVISNHDLISGTIAQSFHNAKSEKEAEKALKEAKKMLWGNKEEKRASIPESYKSYIEYLFDNKCKQNLLKIIVSFQIELHSKTYDEELYKRFCSQIIPAEYSQELFIYMLGWVTEQVNLKTKEGQAAFIHCKEFHDELQKQVTHYNHNSILAAVSVRPSAADTQVEMERQDTYIKQLSLIDMSFDEMLKASSDFLRTSAETTIWAARGFVTSKSFEEYCDGIERIWANKKRMVMFSGDKHDGDSHRGQVLYSMCQDGVDRLNVDGKIVPEFFGPGTLHRLANAPVDEPRIGWHPQYKDILKERGKADEC